MQKQKNFLIDIAAIRIIAIISVVLGHACISLNSNHWSVPGLTLTSKYSIWSNIATFVYGYHIPLFVALSGYLFAYRKIETNKTESNKLFVKNKIRRLIFPSLVFGSVYWFFFLKGLDPFFISVINGVEHLWFLPMIFLCYVIFKLTDPLITKFPYITLFISLILYFLNFVASYIPVFGKVLSETSHYFLFFLIGYFFYFKKNKLIEKNIKWYLMFIILLFLLLFYYLITVVLQQPIITISTELINKLLTLEFGLMINLGSALLGMLLIYLITKSLERYQLLNEIFIIKFNNWCMGIYIFHQFIMKYILLYHTTSLNKLNADILPLFLFIISLVFSILITWSILKNKYLKTLIS